MRQYSVSFSINKSLRATSCAASTAITEVTVTAETDKKKVYSYPTEYTKYDDGEDTYIVL